MSSTLSIQSSLTRQLDSGDSLEDAIFQVTHELLEQAEVSLSDLDGIVIGTEDLSEGRVIQSMVTAGSVGAVGRPLMTVASASEHALIAACVQLQSRSEAVILVVSWSKPSETLDFQRIEALATDPIYLRNFGFTPEVAAAMVKSADTNANRISSGLADVYPLNRQEVRPIRDTVTAMLIVRGSETNSECRIEGLGWASTAMEPPLRRSPLEAVSTAAANAANNAGIEIPVRDVEILGVQTGFAYLDSQIAELTVHGSRSYYWGGRTFAAGLENVAAVSTHLSESQGAVGLGVAVSTSGPAAQNASVFILGQTQAINPRQLER